jgi:hypothetical protein
VTSTGVTSTDVTSTGVTSTGVTSTDGRHPSNRNVDGGTQLGRRFTCLVDSLPNTNLPARVDQAGSMY